jgi:tetratricopeptide (TPR) repeat protein
MERTAEPRHARIICVVLALVTLALYLPVVGYDFILFDDPAYITENPHVLQGLTLSGMVWALTTGEASNWHPLAWLSGMLDVQIYGVAHPGGHHLTSVLFHIVNALLLFVVLRRFTGALWRSAVVAALFAWHPIHIESVAWIAERKDVLSTFFLLLTLLAYHRYVKESSAQSPQAKKYYARTLILFACGLMSKPMLVTLPFVLLLLDYWPLGRFAEIPTASPFRKLDWLKLLREKIPMFCLTLGSCIVTYLVQKKGGAVLEVEKFPMSFRIVNAMFAYLGYLEKMIWPSGLTIFYPLTGGARPVAQIVAAVLVLLGITVAAVYLVRQRPYFLFGWLWFLGVLVPVIGLVQVGSQSMADRYSYMSLVGIFIIIVWGLADLLGNGRLNRLNAAWAILIPALTACVVLTAHNLPYWKNTETLFRRNLEVVRDNSTAHMNLGVYYDHTHKPKEAEREFTAALNLQPHSGLVLSAVGLHYAQQGEMTNAAAFYNNALSEDPSLSDAHYNLGNVLAGEGKLVEAADQYQQALRSKPDSPDAHNNYGAVLLRLGRLTEALDQFKEALRLQPDYPEAQDQLGSVFLKLGHPDVAQLHYEAAVRLKPDFAHAQLQLGLALAEQNYIQEAIPRFQTAIKLEPTNDDAYFNLAAAYTALKRYGEAEQAFNESLRLNPDAQTYARLAGVLQSDGKTDAAIQNYRKALQLRPDSVKALQGLAWILAADNNAQFRNGAEAVKLAEHANDLSGQKQLLNLMTLDVAYAEAGRFEDAIKTAQQVRQLATAQNQKDFADKASQRIALYQSGKAFHE